MRTDISLDQLSDNIPIILEPTLLLLTHSAFHSKTALGLNFAKNFVTQWQTQLSSPIDLNVFLYGDAAMLANRLIWLPADTPNVAKEWQQFAQTSGIMHQVCVSTALARGVVDSDNAKRHGLIGENLAEGFQLVGLGELAMLMHRCNIVQQF